MADRVKPVSNAASMKPVPMKLFATWEVDRTPPNCIPRLCTLTLTRLVLLKPLGSDFTSIIIAVKMQSSKRTLRSNEIFLPSTELLDTELDLTFSLQYPHFLKRDGNKLQIMLQRRKKYKNRTILGFKTLAVGIVNMAQVLQRAVDKELELYADLKEKNNLVAKVVMLTLSSQPVDHEESESRKLSVLTEPDRSVDAENYSDEDEDFSSNEEGSDSEPMLDDGDGVGLRKGSRKGLPAAARQRNLKQKFIALLKRFKVTDEGLDSEQDHEGNEPKSEHGMDPQEIEDLFDELEDLSDSGPDMDTVSIMSTPKPSLRPFFPSSRSLVQENPDKLGSDRLSDESSKKADSDGHTDAWTDHECSDPQQVATSPPGSASGEDKRGSSTDKRPKLFMREKTTSNSKEKRVSISKEKLSVDRSNSVCIQQQDSSPRKVLLEQLGKVFPTDDYIPDYVILVNTVETQGLFLAQRLQEKQHRVICTGTPADVRATIVCLVNKIQKFCNTNSKAPLPIKVAVAGNDSYIHSVVRPYVEQLSSKPPDWQSYIKFLIIPIGANSLAKFLGGIDSMYHSTFLDSTWKDSLEKSEGQKTEYQEVVNRVSCYINNAISIIQLPIGEAMVNYKVKNSDDESSQMFIPFVNNVHIGVSEPSAPTSGTSVDLDEATSATSMTTSSSPPSGSHLDKPKDITPPSSPNINYNILQTMSSSQTSQTSLGSQEPLDLVIDYWTIQAKGDSNKKAEGNKNTLKATFRSLQFVRLPNCGQMGTSTLAMSYVTKEKKQKIMRLGKKKEKEKDSDAKSTIVEGINRLICLAKAHRLKVTIDGSEWNGVKFFQLSSQWQTHVKYFPVALLSPTDVPLVIDANFARKAADLSEPIACLS